MDDLGDHPDSQRTHKKIPICVVEDHHQVVPFLHENIRKRLLPLEGNCLIHLDSHPDMLIPKDMPAEYAFDSRRLYETHDIENWIIPNCYTGIFRHLVWVKPPWCNQIKNKSQKMIVGRCKESQTIRLECRETYFIAEGLFKLKRDLDDVKEVTLDCLTLGYLKNQTESDIVDIGCVLKNIQGASIVLDIDLDFFSTQNPFRQLYKDANLYVRLKKLFNFTPPQSDSDSDIIQAQEKRLVQIEELEKLFNYLNDFKKLPDVEENGQNSVNMEVKALIESMTEHYSMDSIDWNLVFSAGCTIDDHELPHHVSTDEELELMFNSFEKFLQSFTVVPTIITISRSSSDDYTPLNQVEYIQSKVLEILNSKFNCDVPILSYLDDDDDDESSDSVHDEKLDSVPTCETVHV